MHSRFFLALLLIAAIFGMAMHAAVDVAHAANATHADCGDAAGSGSAPDDSGDAAKDVTHCCAAACHGWAAVPIASASLGGLSSREPVPTNTEQLASFASDGLRRPPRQSSEAAL